MRFLVSIWYWLRAHGRGRTLRSEIDEELEYHLQMRADELGARGLSRREARRVAQARFGDIELTRRACRELYMVSGNTGDEAMSEIWSDVRQTLRGVRKHPGFSIAVILTLGLGIGANSAIFSVLNGVILRPLPYEDPGELVRLWQADRVNGTRFENYSAPDFFDVVERTTVFGAAAAVESRSVTLTGSEGTAERITAIAASHSLTNVLGLPPTLGRWFTQEEDVPGGEAVAVLGRGLWEARYGADAAVLGRSVNLDGVAYRIVGVANGRIAFPREDVLLWVPLQVSSASRPRGQHNFPVIARLADDVPLERANANLATVAATLEQEYAAENTGRDLWAQPLHESVVGNISTALYLISGAVALVLLIACVNVVNLLLARSHAREREVAVRLALGAGRGRLVRGLLTEYLVLGVLGGAVGLALATIGVRALLAVGPTSLPRLPNVSVDGSVISFTAAVAFGTALLCGLLPAIQGSRTDLRPALSEGGRGASSGKASRRVRDGLVVLEVALAVVLVSGSGLLLQSLSQLQAVDPGFTPAGVLSAEVQLPPSRYEQNRADWPNYPAVLGFQSQVAERAMRLPGATSVGFAMNGPTDPGWTTGLSIEGEGHAEIDPTEEVRIRIISSGYPETVGMELVRGRLPDPRDDLFETPPVALINEALAERYFPDHDPLGQRISNWGISREIIGVVQDVRFMGLAGPAPPAVYPLFARMPLAAFSILIRTTGEPLALVGPLRGEVRELDADLALGSFGSLENMLAATTGESRFNALLVTVFAAVAMMLAAVGIYGVVSYGVSQQTREIGVRLSLGATSGRVVGETVGQALRLTGLGVALGLLGAVGSTRIMTSLLFGVRALDPVRVLCVVALSLTMAAAAAYLPARRASRVDAMRAVQGE